MLSRQGKTILSGAMLAIALAMPASAVEPDVRRGPAAAFCADARKELMYYFALFEKGGTSKQEEVWKKQYKRRIYNYKQTKCAEIEKEIAGALNEKEPEKMLPGAAGFLAGRNLAR